MSHARSQEEVLVERLRRALPLHARGRPPLLAFLRARRLIGNVSPKLKVVSIFPAGARGDFICRFMIEGGASSETFFAPLAQIALDRRYPAARELALCRR